MKIAQLYWLRNATFEVSAGGGAGTLRLLGSRPGSRSPVHTVRLHTSCSIPELNEGGKSFVKEKKKRRESTPFVSQDLLQKKKRSMKRNEGAETVCPPTMIDRTPIRGFIAR